MNYPFFALILILLFCCSLCIGKKSAHQNANNLDYFLSGRSLKVYGLTLSLLATQLGGGALIGNGDAAFKYGWAALCYSLGLSLGLFVLALGIGARFRKLNVNTLPELFQKKYNSNFLQTFAASFSIISLFLILMAIGIAARKMFISIGIDSPIFFLMFWSVAIVYTVMGGLSAVVKTDILKIIFVAMTLFIVFAFLMFNHPNPSLGFTYSPQTQIHALKIPWNEWILMPLMFVIIGQDMGQRCSAANSSKTVSSASLWAAILLLLLSAIPTFIGTLASATHFTPTNPGSVLMNFVESNTTPYLTSLFAAAILMAILSTVDSLVCSVSLNISQDILHKIIPSIASDIKISRLVTFIVGLGAMMLSFLFNDIIPTMVFAYKISIYALFVPIIMAVLFDKPKYQAAYISIVIGLFLFVISEFVYSSAWFDLFSIFIALLIFLIVQIKSDLITPSFDKK